MTSHSIFLSLLFATLGLSGMEKVLPVIVSQPPSARVAVQESFLRLHNTTNDTLLVRYQAFGETQFCHRTLIPGQWLDFAHTGEIASLKVKALGYKWISAEPFKGLSNLADLAHKESKQLDTPGVKIIVSPAWNSVGTRSLAAYALAVVCETVLPYRFECQACDRLEVYSKLTDIFAQVEKALQDEVPLEPRHFLSLPEQATGYDIQKSYESLMSFWDPKQKDTDAETQRFARDVIPLINAAYKALVYKNDEWSQLAEHQQVFRLMVREKLFNNVQIYNAQSNIIDALKSIIRDKGRAIKGATSCKNAVTALEDLKRTCPRFKAVMLLRQANEFIIYWLAKKFFGSYSIEALAQGAFALGTQAAVDWLTFQIEKKNEAEAKNEIGDKNEIEEKNEWRRNSFFIFTVFERFNQPFYLSLAKVLAKYRKALNVRNAKGNTPLMEAVLREDFETAYFLIAQNADRSITNNEKKLAYQLAEEKGKQYEGAKRLQWDDLIAQLSQGQLAFNPHDSYVGEFRKQ